MTQIHIETGDLTEYDVDAIVNAANNDLRLGGGLAGAIGEKGGAAIQAECDAHGLVAVGQAALTGAGDLPARYVIHQASMRMGAQTTAEALRDSTRAVLRLAEQHHLRTLAFPATGTGIAGFPVDQCAEIMIGEVLDHLDGQTGLEDVYFVLFRESDRQAFQDALDDLAD